MLIILYPKFTNYLMSVFSPDLPALRAALLLRGVLPLHLLLRLGKVLIRWCIWLWASASTSWARAIMMIANAWLTFMMSPRGVSSSGRVLCTWDAVYNYTWMPINVHRIIANVAFGGSIAAAYAAFKFLQATPTRSARTTTGWATSATSSRSAPSSRCPFAGYWLAKEIYAYSQTLGLTMMGGAFSWLFIIQAVLIGNLFLAANYYLWLGMGRVEGAQPLPEVHQVPAHPRSRSASWSGPRRARSSRPSPRSRAMGGSSHPVLGYLGVMSAKNTAVNILILTTFMSFLLYRRTGKAPTVRVGEGGQCGCSSRSSPLAAAIFVIFLGVYGYFVEANGPHQASRCRRSARCSSRWSRSPPSTSSCSGTRRDRRGALGPDPPASRSTC